MSCDHSNCETFNEALLRAGIHFRDLEKHGCEMAEQMQAILWGEAEWTLDI